MAAMDQPLSTAPDIRHRIWQDLQRATQGRYHEWRTPVLSTVGVDGLPQARTVVLRQTDAKLGALKIYTDSRSPKVADLNAKPGAFLVFWSKRLSWQLRVRAMATVLHSGPEVDAVWGKVSQSAAAGDYLSDSAPGDQLPSNAPGILRGASSETADETDSGNGLGDAAQPLHHLAIITLQIQEIDWLELARSGHRRALIRADDWQWLVP